MLAWLTCADPEASRYHQSLGNKPTGSLLFSLFFFSLLLPLFFGCRLGGKFGQRQKAIGGNCFAVLFCPDWRLLGWIYRRRDNTYKYVCGTRTLFRPAPSTRAAPRSERGGVSNVQSRCCNPPLREATGESTVIVYQRRGFEYTSSVGVAFFLFLLLLRDLLDRRVKMDRLGE